MSEMDTRFTIYVHVQNDNIIFVKTCDLWMSVSIRSCIHMHRYQAYIDVKCTCKYTLLSVTFYS